MSSDDRIAPISSVGADSVDPVDALRPTTPARPVDQVRHAAAPSPADPLNLGVRAANAPTIATAIDRADITSGNLTPASVAAGTTVHDAAEHGDPIARAIERAHPAPGTVLDGTDRAQQLAAAAASAGAGQGIAHPDDTKDERDERIDPVDYLAPLRRADNSDERARDRREEAAAEPDAQLDPDTEADGIADIVIPPR